MSHWRVRTGETVVYGLRQLATVGVVGVLSRGGQADLVGAHRLLPERMGAMRDYPCHRAAAHPAVGGAYSEVLRQHEVWDNSNDNSRRLQTSCEGALVPFSCVPELTASTRHRQDIDLLFYGALNPRRETILIVWRWLDEGDARLARMPAPNACADRSQQDRAEYALLRAAAFELSALPIFSPMRGGRGRNQSGRNCRCRFAAWSCRSNI